MMKRKSVSRFIIHNSSFIIALFGLLMKRPLVIFRAEFRVFYAARLFAFVFRRRVIPHFADGTLECNNVSHDVFLKRKTCAIRICLLVQGSRVAGLRSYSKEWPT